MILKNLLSYMLIFVIIFQPLNKGLIFIAFKINQNEIAKTVCVNKGIENNQCQGKCYLNKQLVQADQNTKKNIPVLQNERYEVWGFNPPYFFDFYVNRDAETQKRGYHYSIGFYALDFIFTHLHPPEVTAF